MVKGTRAAKSHESNEQTGSFSIHSFALISPSATGRIMTAAAPEAATESSSELKRLSVIEPYATKVRSAHPPAAAGSAGAPARGRAQQQRTACP